MIILFGTTVAVADGETLNLFHAMGDANNIQLRAMAHPAVDDNTKDSGAGRSSSSGNPDES
jgi:protein required for attachment to host cells